MAATPKKRVTSPIGDLMYVMISGQGKENYDGDGYEYQTCVDVADKDADAFIDEIEDFMEDNAPKGGEQASIPYKTIEDDDTIPEGIVRFTFKTMTEFEDNKGVMKNTVIDILDAAGNKTKLPENVFIGNGSTGKAIGSLVLWTRGNRKKTEYGASLYLNKVQIKDFTPYEGETVDEIEGGSFKGFETLPTKDDDSKEDETPRRKRRSRRDRG